MLPGPGHIENVDKFMQTAFPGLSLISRLIHPREIDDIVTFICSTRAAGINGSEIRAEGGLVRSVC